MATGRIQPQTPVKSVADADCFGFVRFMAMNANTLGDYGSKFIIAFCQACGKAFIKRGNWQKYCGTPEYPSVRNKNKAKDYYYCYKQAFQQNTNFNYFAIQSHDLAIVS